MNVLIIGTNQSFFPMPVMPIGACMVAEAAERAGHKVSMLDLMFERDPVRAIASALRKSNPDVIGLSVRNIDNNDMQRPMFYIPGLSLLIQAIRSRTEVPIILGGAALTVMPEEILRATGISSAVLGDGEVTFPLLLERLSRGEPLDDLAGIALLAAGEFRANPPASTGSSNDCMTPDYQRWIDVRSYQSHLSTAPLQTKLGCQFQCSYCTYRKIEGNTYRFSDPGQVAASAVRLASSGLRDIEFVDSVFNVPHDHAMAVSEALARSKPRARFQSLELNPLYFDDALLAAMEQAGFVGIGLTVESASDEVLQGLRKGFTARHVHAAAEIVRRHHLPCVWIFLLGGPGETQETVRETLRFAGTAIRPQNAVFFNIGIRIYPGTELESIARRQGVLTLPAAKMLRPVFYVSPEVDFGWITRQVKNAMNSHMNFMSGDSLNLPFLPAIHRVGYRLGLRPPLWRHTRFIRRGLRFAGMDV
ncbi:MAG: cobalamin-dependent protein [Deltaproteobacteria bacterium]|nr:cobalamin-dependent protein [Deltaproteobacteria bacterium]